MFESVISFFTFSDFWLFLIHDCPLAGKTRCLLEIFSVNTVNSAATACNVGVLKPTVHDLSNSSYGNTKFV